VAANPANVPPTQAGYTITATPIGIQAQDTICASFTVDQTGTQTSTGTGSLKTCWG
jgi:type IV pilus assembly protein PilE